MELCGLVNSVLPGQYASSDYFSELSKAFGCLAEEERSTEVLERERTEEGEDVFKKKKTYGAIGEAPFH